MTKVKKKIKKKIKKININRANECSAQCCANGLLVGICSIGDKWADFNFDVLFSY